MNSGLFTFKGVTQLGEQQFTTSLGINLQMFLDTAFLEIGGFYNINIPTSGAYGGDFSRLRPVNDPYFTNRVYEGVRSNWVYESGLLYNIQPIKISGAFVNGAFVPKTGVNGFKVNYPLGRIIFNSTQTGIVRLEYSYKHVKVSTIDVPWAQRVMTDSFRVDNNDFLQKGSGVWETLSHNRVQLPAIVVEPLTRVRMQGLELGGGQRRLQDVFFHVIASNTWDRNNITDILVNQRNKTLLLFDVTRASQSGKFPLDPYYGDYVSGGYIYTSLIDENLGYTKRKCAIIDTGSDDLGERNGLYISTVRWSTDSELPET
jgi:hypothetical protein